MAREFNDTGTCIPTKHYMVDISDKLDKITRLIEKGKYFTINRPRQYGKTTTLYLLSKRLNKGNTYLALKISFEGISSEAYQKEESFVTEFLYTLLNSIQFLGFKSISHVIESKINKVNSIGALSRFINELVKKITSELNRKPVLMIDEVDKSSNNQLFLDFIAMLRNKYLLQNEGSDYTFHTVILAGVHDVKLLKLKIRPDKERKFNSPWNIAVDFIVDMTFNTNEIATMLAGYVKEKKIEMDIPEIAGALYYYTSGYPFLVSKICKIIDEEILSETTLSQWDKSIVDRAADLLCKRENTNFESLIKNLENNKELYELVEKILLDGLKIEYSVDNILIKLGTTYGILKNEGIVRIHNRIYEQRIYNYMSINLQLKNLLDTDMAGFNFRDNFIRSDNSLDMEKVCIKFQQFMKEQYSKKDKEFLERNGRLLFLAFIKPIINTKGFDFKEVQISEEKRLDVIITYVNKKFIVELKKWYGEQAHQKGLSQLSDYLNRLDIEKGYLIIFDSTYKGQKEWKPGEWICHEEKDIFVVRV